MDHADLASAVAVSVARCHLALALRDERLEWPACADHLQDLGGCDDMLRAPAVGAAHVHELDEAQDLGPVPEMRGHVGHAMVVDASANDHVDLDGREPCLAGRV